MLSRQYEDILWGNYPIEAYASCCKSTAEKLFFAMVRLTFFYQFVLDAAISKHWMIGLSASL